MPVYSSGIGVTAQKRLSCLFCRTDQKDRIERADVQGKAESFQISSGRSWNWSVTGGGVGREIETCAAQESVAVEIEIFSAFEEEFAATSGVEEASCGEETACEEGDALWESARPSL